MKKIRQSIFTYVMSLAILLLFPIMPAAAEGLEVHFLDVGQGDCTVIRQGGHTMLIDAGGNDDADEVINYLSSTLGVHEIDYVIGTHPHEDHIGGLDSVISSFDIENVMLPDVVTGTDTFMDVLTAINDAGLGITTPVPGGQYQLGDASFTVLGPVGDYGDDLNNWSIALKVVYGDNRFLFTGDAESKAEQDIVGSGADLSADVFQAGHHGSETSNTDALLDAASPSYTVISCGENNSYGHPDSAALDRFSARGIQVFRTDLQGTVIADSDGSSITWSMAPADNGQGVANGYDVAPEEIQPQVQDGIQVHITETGSKYHSAGCQYLKNSDITVSLQEVKSRGLEPCGKCSPPQ